MKAEKAVVAGGGESEGVDGPLSNHSRRRSFGTKPSWLLFTIADLDERMKMLTSNIPQEDNADSFAGRAESYYHKRPQLLALLQDLYNGYLSLADRYCQSLTKHHRRQHSSPIPIVRLVNHFDEVEDAGNFDSDVESSLSYQTPFCAPVLSKLDIDMIVAELVIKNVDYEIIQHELSIVEQRRNESSRKIELQKSLLEVLESERLILLNENASLGYRVNALMEENKGLVSESLFMKRRTGELARCMLKTREDHRVCMLSRKIEDLQGQIYGLEKRNKEYYEQLVKQEEVKKCKTRKKKTKSGGGEVTLDDCFEKEAGGGTLASVMKGRWHGYGSDGSGKRASKLWDRVKKFDLFLCGPHYPNGC